MSSTSETMIKHLKTLTLFSMVMVLSITKFSAQSDGLQSTPSSQQILVVPPAFPGGEEALFAYLGEVFRVEEYKGKSPLRGVVYVRAWVDETGRMDQERIEIIRSVHPGISKKAMEAVKAMPAWIPGTENGVPKGMEVMIPISFSMYWLEVLKAEEGSR